MNYILIFVFLWHADATSQSVKFHSLSACQAAADLVSKQAKKEGHQLPVLVCAKEH